jgi:hypothetical protein
MFPYVLMEDDNPENEIWITEYGVVDVIRLCEIFGDNMIDNYYEDLHSNIFENPLFDAETFDYETLPHSPIHLLTKINYLNDDTELIHIFFNEISIWEGQNTDDMTADIMYNLFYLMIEIDHKTNMKPIFKEIYTKHREKFHKKYQNMMRQKLYSNMRLNTNTIDEIVLFL